MLKMTIVAALLLAGGWYYATLDRSVAQTSDDQMAALIADIELKAKEANQSAPHMIDEYTRFDKVVAGPGAKVTYQYSLPTLASFELDAHRFATETSIKVTNLACKQKQMRHLMGRGTTFAYSYKTSDGVTIGLFSVDQSDCDSVLQSS